MQSAAGDNNTAGGTRHPPLLGTDTIAIIECLDGIVFVFNEAFLADFGPYCEEVDLRTLIVDLVRLYRMNQIARAANRQQWPGEVELLRQFINIHRALKNLASSHKDREA